MFLFFLFRLLCLGHSKVRRFQTQGFFLRENLRCFQSSLFHTDFLLHWESMWINFLYAGQVQSTGKKQVQCTWHKKFLFQRCLKQHPVMMPCFKLKGKRHLQRRNECLAEIAACCKLEPTSGTGVTPGGWLEQRKAECCPVLVHSYAAPSCSPHRHLGSSCFYCISSVLPALELKHFACLFSAGKCWCL